MLQLNNVTLFGLDTKRYPSLLKASAISCLRIQFGSVILFNEQQVTINSGKDYSEFIINKLPDYINTEFVLIIQADGYVLNPEAWDDRFLDYDYIGAPWLYDTMDVGNGGFSLRSKRFLDTARKIFQSDTNPDFHPEDNYLCRKKYHDMIKAGIKIAPASLAKNFSMEANAKYGNKWNGQFGFHNDRITDISDYEQFI